MLSLINDDALNALNNLDDLSIDLVICDPPYFKTINQTWDYQWRTEQDYIEWVEQWVKILSSKLRYGGSMYLFGYFRTLCKLVPIFESLGFELRQQIVLNKGMKSVAGRATKNYRMFPNVTESCLFFVKDPHVFTQKLLLDAKRRKGISAKEINEALGVKANGGGMWSIYTGKNICKQVPTEDLWNKLCAILDLKVRYSSIAQTYTPILGLTDVWDDIDFYEKPRYHPTQKPLKLIERLVLASSRCGDIVLDPFMGGGTTGVVCSALDRDFIGIEKDVEYFNICQNRLNSLQ